MKLRKFLYPFSILYDGVTRIRNLAYDRGWKSSTSFEVPVICVGNLSVGGTGKSPMIEYLISLLKSDYSVAILSRGYKRKTSGYLEVQTDHSANDVGDEPLQFKQKFPEVMVAVCANRQEGIKRLQAKAEVILLDDAFQHRKVKPNYTILLTTFDKLYIDDLVLPAGDLRESSQGASRADAIVVTKIPAGIAYAKLQEIQFRLQPQTHQRVYFSKIDYDQNIYSATDSLPLTYLKDKKFTLVTGIANPKPLTAYLTIKGYTFEHAKFPDHHDFSDSEIEQLKGKELILTTEKDYMRLHPQLQKFALYYLPIKTQFLHEGERLFEKELRLSLENFRST